MPGRVLAGSPHKGVTSFRYFPAARTLRHEWHPAMKPTDRAFFEGLVLTPSARSAVGAGRVQRHGRANKSLQCLLVNLLALVEVDGTPGVAIEA
jgi:hypothetical protein